MSAAAPAEYENCLQAVTAKITRAGGWLRFDHFLQFVLHHPQYGYYGSGRIQLGSGGDFHTAPTISPLFAETLATVIPPYSADGDILELGAGTGALAEQLLNYLPEHACRRYYILETSAALARRQQQRLQQYPQLKWLTALPDRFNGFIIANEVLDCLPFRLLRREKNRWWEQGVALGEENAPAFDLRPVEAANDITRLPLLADGYQTEISPQADALTGALAHCLNRGLLLLIDYGYGSDEYYHPQRRSGTMMCYHRQRADDNPLVMVGEKDISAHVNFSAVAEAGMQGGCRLAGYVTQAQGLINGGITDILTRYTGDVARYARATAGAHKLLAPHEMGEIIKWMGFTKGNLPPPPIFSSGDLCHRL